MINKIIKFVTSRLVYILVGIFISITFVAVNAFTPSVTTVSSGQTLSASVWNNMVNDINNIKGDIDLLNVDQDGGYKLLASSNSIDEETRIILRPDGTRNVATVGSRYISVTNASWDPNLSFKEIVLVARNGSDAFCAGGSGTIDVLLGRNTDSTCQYCGYSGTTYSCNGSYSGQDDWIALDINGTRMNTCPQSVNTSEGAVYGYFGIGAKCIYQIGGKISSITVSQADWSDGLSDWAWELYYR